MKPRNDSVEPDRGSRAPRLVLGIQPVREAIRAHRDKLGSVLVQRGEGENGRLDALARFATDQGVATVQRVARRELERVSGGVYHQGAAAWAPDLQLVSPDAVLGAANLLVIALDGIQDPQNFGAVVRSAVGLGATAIVWPENSSAPLTAATFRASAGAIEHATLCRIPSLVRFIDDGRASGAAVIGLVPDAATGLEQIDLRTPTIFVVGSEHDGIARAVRKRCTAFARLTLPGPVASLNASVAAGIALHMAAVQRMKSNTSDRP